MITINKRGLNGLSFDFYTNDEFFKEEFTVSVKWDKIEFSRPTLDTKRRIRKASKNHGAWSFTLALDNAKCGRYFEYEKTEDNLILEL